MNSFDTIQYAVGKSKNKNILGATKRRGGRRDHCENIRRVSKSAGREGKTVIFYV